MSVLSPCMYVFYVCAWYSRMPEDGTRSGTRVNDGCEPPCGWVLGTKPGSSRTTMFLIVKPSLQLRLRIFIIKQYDKKIKNSAEKKSRLIIKKILFTWFF